MHCLSCLDEWTLQVRHVVFFAVVMSRPRRIVLEGILFDVCKRSLDRSEDVLRHSLVEHLPLSPARHVYRRRVRVHLVTARAEIDPVVVVAGTAAPGRQPRMPVDSDPLVQLDPSRTLLRLAGSHHTSGVHDFQAVDREDALRPRLDLDRTRS